MSILIIAETIDSKLSLNTGKAISASMKIGGDIDVLVVGDDIDVAAQDAAKLAGISSIIKAQNPIYKNIVAEDITPLIMDIANNYSHIMAASSTFAKDYMPRVAALLDVAQISDISEIISADKFIRPIYAGNAFATVESSDKIKVITVRTSSFDSAGTDGNAQITESSFTPSKSGLSEFVSNEVSGSENARPDLTVANAIVSGGRGVGSKENFALVEALADKLGGAVGASRAAVDAGYASNDLQVGQTGKIVAPDLYIAAGISGAIQHLAGMKESKTIVAINTDENAPIFDIADYGIVADLNDVLPELTSSL